MKRYDFLHPIGFLSKEPLYAEYYSFSTAGGGASDAPTGPVRPRSSSNATLDVRDIRRGMAHSFTDLFSDFKIKDPTDVCPPYLD